MMILLITVHVIVCLILILVILLQAGRGQGLAGPSFASGNVQSLFGTRAADFLTKATSVAAIFFLFTCIGLDIIESRKSRSLLEGVQRPAPIDMETIKKALEKAKSDEAAKKLQTGAADLAKTVPSAPPAKVETAVKTAAAHSAATASPAPKATGESKP